MSNQFQVHTIESAPEKSKALLQQAMDAFGMVPNFHAVIAESPEALEAYMKLHELFLQSSLSTTEKHVVWLTINVENACHYCTPAHAMLAKMDEVDDDIVSAIRNKTEIPDQKLEALRVFTQKIVQQRGNVDDNTLGDFYAAGYSKQNVLEVLLCLSQKILSNYSNHITHTPLDEPFQPYA